MAAACQLLHEQGIENTTLAHIAQAADVPVGNVYYYFKTKDEIIGAVVETHAREIAGVTASIERRHRTPKGRLKALVGALVQQRELITLHGCPIGTLCSELNKRGDGPDSAPAALMRTLIGWAEGQFRLMGRHNARELAVDLIANYEGVALLTNTLQDPALLTSAGRRLERWIDSMD